MLSPWNKFGLHSEAHWVISRNPHLVLNLKNISNQPLFQFFNSTSDPVRDSLTRIDIHSCFNLFITQSHSEKNLQTNGEFSKNQVWYKHFVLPSIDLICAPSSPIITGESVSFIHLNEQAYSGCSIIPVCGTTDTTDTFSPQCGPLLAEAFAAPAVDQEPFKDYTNLFLNWDNGFSCSVKSGELTVVKRGDRSRESFPIHSLLFQILSDCSEKPTNSLSGTYFGPLLGLHFKFIYDWNPDRNGFKALKNEVYCVGVDVA